jgi:2-oxoglutarate ferredoxin oxidoreductase subunit gamma
LRRHKRNLQKTEIRISGLGGQGVVLAGQVLGRAAVHEGKNAVQTQTYGAEARGSLAKSEVIISDGKIGFPIVRKCDVLIAMNQEALERNLQDLKENGVLILDNSIVKNVPVTKARLFKVPATQIAEDSCGGKIYANMVMLGVLVTVTRIVNEGCIKLSIKDSLGEKGSKANISAFEKGEEAITDY